MKQILKGINYSQSIIVIASQCGVGKTSLLIELAKESIKKGEKVLFVSDDSKSQLLGKLGFTNSLLKIVELDYLFSNIDNLNIDVLILDVSHKLTDLQIMKLSNKSFSSEMKILISSQLQKTVKYNINFVDSISSSRLVHMATVIYGLTKKTKFSFIEKIKYFFLFWLKKPNLTINTIKHRYENIPNFDIYIDYTFK